MLSLTRLVNSVNGSNTQSSSPTVSVKVNLRQKATSQELTAATLKKSLAKSFIEALEDKLNGVYQGRTPSEGRRKIYEKYFDFVTETNPDKDFGAKAKISGFRLKTAYRDKSISELGFLAEQLKTDLQQDSKNGRFGLGFIPKKNSFLPKLIELQDHYNTFAVLQDSYQNLIKMLETCLEGFTQVEACLAELNLPTKEVGELAAVNKDMDAKFTLLGQSLDKVNALLSEFPNQDDPTLARFKELAQAKSNLYQHFDQLRRNLGNLANSNHQLLTTNAEMAADNTESSKIIEHLQTELTGLREKVVQDNKANQATIKDQKTLISDLQQQLREEAETSKRIAGDFSKTQALLTQAEQDGRNAKLQVIDLKQQLTRSLGLIDALGGSIVSLAGSLPVDKKQAVLEKAKGIQFEVQRALQQIKDNQADACLDRVLASVSQSVSQLTQLHSELANVSKGLNNLNQGVNAIKQSVDTMGKTLAEQTSAAFELLSKAHLKIGQLQVENERQKTLIGQQQSIIQQQDGQITKAQKSETGLRAEVAIIKDELQLAITEKNALHELYTQQAEKIRGLEAALAAQQTIIDGASKTVAKTREKLSVLFKHAVATDMTGIIADLEKCWFGGKAKAKKVKAALKTVCENLDKNADKTQVTEEDLLPLQAALAQPRIAINGYSLCFWKSSTASRDRFDNDVLPNALVTAPAA